MRHSRNSESKKPKQSFFERFSLFFFDKGKTTFTLWIALLVFGVLSYTTFLSRQGFPNVEIPYSIVNGTYFAGDAAKLDKAVTVPITDAIRKQEVVKQVQSFSSANFFTIYIEYKSGTTSAQGSEKIKQAIEAAKAVPASAQVNYEVAAASKFINKYDSVLAGYIGNGNDPAMLQKHAEAAVAFLNQQLPSGVRVEVVQQLKTGINPVTGEKVTEQASFDRYGYLDNGQPRFFNSVTLGVINTSKLDALQLEDSLKDAINKWGNKDGFYVVISGDFGESIRSQISGLQKSLVEGLLVVIAVSLLLISLRAGFITAITMTTVLAITVGIMYVAGLTLNTITLFGLILCLGLIVDDTTIMIEALDAARKLKLAKRDTVALVAKKVARASTAGTFTTMLAFAPMLFIGGILGGFIRALPITIITSLAVSLLVSLSLVPFLAKYIVLRKTYKPSRNPFQRAEKAVSGRLAKLLLVGRRSRKKGVALGIAGILISFVVFMGSLSFFKLLKFDIFPSTKDSDTILVTAQFAPNTTIEKAQVLAVSIDQTTGEVLGKNLRRLTYTNSGETSGFTANVDLISYQDRDVKAPELVKNLQAKLNNIDGARVKVAQLDVGPPKEDLPFRAQIHGDAAATTTLANDITAFLKGKKLARTNGTNYTVTRAEISQPTSITRIDGTKVIEVRAGFDADDVSALVTQTQSAVEKEFDEAKLKTYGLDKDALKFDFGNESNNQESFKSMMMAFPILLLVMYILLALQFKSFLQPALIFFAIPFSFFGVAAGLHYTNNPLSFFVMIGFFALIGIAVNNTILLTDFANQARSHGKGRLEAIAEAVQERFRPLVATSLTSVVALLPLALSDPFWESMAYTLIFGLLSSTILVIVAFPYYYLAGEALSVWLKGKYHKLLLLLGLVLVVVAGVLVSPIVAALLFGAYFLLLVIMVIRMVITLPVTSK